MILNFVKESKLKVLENSNNRTTLISIMSIHIIYLLSFVVVVVVFFRPLKGKVGWKGVKNWTKLVEFIPITLCARCNKGPMHCNKCVEMSKHAMVLKERAKEKK